MTDNALFLLPTLRRARDLIDREYAEPLDLDAMAREAGYSRFHFARAFAMAYGETPPGLPDPPPDRACKDAAANREPVGHRDLLPRRLLEPRFVQRSLPRARGSVT
jgi:AraC-like DNA-binding protein